MKICSGNYLIFIITEVRGYISGWVYIRSATFLENLAKSPGIYPVRETEYISGRRDSCREFSLKQSDFDDIFSGL